MRELVCRPSELPNHFGQVLNDGEGVVRIVDEGFKKDPQAHLSSNDNSDQCDAVP